MIGYIYLMIFARFSDYLWKWWYQPKVLILFNLHWCYFHYESVLVCHSKEITFLDVFFWKILKRIVIFIFDSNQLFWEHRIKLFIVFLSSLHFFEILFRFLLMPLFEFICFSFVFSKHHIKLCLFLAFCLCLKLLICNFFLNECLFPLW